MTFTELPLNTTWRDATTTTGTVSTRIVCGALDHDYAHAEVPAEGRVYLYCRKCGDVRKLEVIEWAP